MKKFTSVLAFLSLVSLFSLGVFSMQVAHATSSGIVMSEVSTGSTDSASDEFVELYNNSSDAIAVGSWTAEYKSATGKTWSKRATISAEATLAAHEYLVLSTKDGAAQHLSSGMAQSGGNLRLRDAGGVVVDQLAWGDGDSAEGSPVESAALGQSLARGFDATLATYPDTDDNSADFTLASPATPGAVPQTAEVPQDTTGGAGDPQANSSASILLWELFPDPQSPLSDSRDEFIEIYNDGSAPADLTGWSLRDKTGHVYKISGLILEPHQFYSFTSAVTKISLNNDGDVISLLDASGAIHDVSSSYGAAKPGLSWGVTDGGWAWLIEPTPGYSNASVIAPTPSDAKITPTKKSATKAKTNRKSSTKSPKKTTRVAKAASGKVTPYTTPAAVVQNAKLWSWLLIALGIGTIGYGIYAYKPEITHIIHQLRTKLRGR